MSEELKQAAQQALEALDEIHAGKRHPQLALAVAHNLRRALTQRPAAQTWDKNADVCKGAWELGTACGTCAKCIATKPAQRPAAQTEREAFEAWATSVGYHTERDMFQRDKYQSTVTWELWRVWQARASLPAPQQATPEPVLTVEKEPDYWSGGHFHEGSKPHIDPTKVWSLPIGTKLFTRPAPGVPETDADALLDFMEAHRVSVTPEYEGQWCARQYDDEPQAVAEFEAATPRDAIRALAAAQAKGADHG